MSWAVLFALISVFSPVFAELPRPLLSRGAVFVHVQPFDQAATRLSFELRSLAALSADGTAVPIPLSLKSFAGKEMARQRRLGAGPLPPGRYTGLTLSVSRARLKGADGAADLIVPEGPVEIPVLFQVQKGRAATLLLELDSGAAVEEGFRFTPAFSARLGVSPPLASIGLASSPERNHLCLFDKNSTEVFGYVPTLRGPSGMVLDLLRNRVYVALAGEDQVIAVDLQERLVLETLRLQGGDEPTELAMNAEGTILLSANAGSRTVSFIDPRSMVEADRVVVRDRPRSVLIDERRQRAWVFDTAASGLTVLDLTRRIVIGNVATDSEPFRGQFNRRGEALYVIHHRAPWLTVINPETLAVEARVLLGSPGTAIRVDPRTDLIYVAPAGTGSIDVYDPLSLLPVETLPVPGDVSFLTLDGDQSLLFSGVSGRDEVLVFPVAGKKIARRMDIGAASYWISLVGER